MNRITPSILGLITLLAITLQACAPLAPRADGGQATPPLPASQTTAPTLAATPTAPEATPTPDIRTAAIAEIQDRVESRRSAEMPYEPAIIGQSIEEGGSVRTGEAARARLDLSDATIVRLAPSTTFTLTTFSPQPTDPVTRFSLEAGKVWMQATKALGGGTFEFETPSGVATVRGSLMGVEYYPANGHMIATCLEGACRLTSVTGASTDLAAGQQAGIPRTGADPTPPQPLDSVRLEEWVREFPEAQAAAATITPGPSPTPTLTFTPSPAPASVNITGEGTAEASTVFSAEFPASLSVDGDLTTSWFSAGPGSTGQTVFRWTGAQDDLIREIAIISNRENSVPAFRTNFGFGTVLVQVLDAAGAVVFEQSLALDGTPDPDVTVTPNVVGRVVVLTFSGHEDPTCGGFGELQITALR